MEQSLKDRELPNAEINELIEQIMIVMPEKMGPTITATLKKQIKESKDDVIQMLYPIIGQLIKKYIQQEMAQLTEKIDKQMEDAFAFDKLIDRVKAFFSGVNYNEIILRNADEPELQQIFLIEEGSGLMLASYTRNKKIDQDIIAGMLTAIKMFVEDAFQKENQQLETIEYSSYKIYIQSFNKFYVAVVLSGTMSAKFKSKLDDNIMKFIKRLSETKIETETLDIQLEEQFKRFKP